MFVVRSWAAHGQQASRIELPPWSSLSPLAVFPTRDSGSGSPLWGLRVIERTSAAGNEPPYLIDPQMLGMLYLGTARFEADPFSAFRKNLTTLRVEVKGLYHVRNSEGARRIAAT
jgi:hypothetical protein